jgi:RimJ/RimL family protein N-acetyltransferase
VLTGEKVLLRAREASDVAVLDTGLYNDVTTRSRADSRPWRPMPPGSATSPYAPTDPSDEVAMFSIVERSSGDLAGEALLWGIDLHRRGAHVGLALLPPFRGRRLASDVLGVLAWYAFTVRGLHRLQIETLASNEAMLNAARRAGFAHEGTLRESAWVLGDYVDEVVLGLVADRTASGRQSHTSGSATQPGVGE